MHTRRIGITIYRIVARARAARVCVRVRRTARNRACVCVCACSSCPHQAATAATTPREPSSPPFRRRTPLPARHQSCPPARPPDSVRRGGGGVPISRRPVLAEYTHVVRKRALARTRTRYADKRSTRTSVIRFVVGPVRVAQRQQHTLTAIGRQTLLSPFVLPLFFSTVILFYLVLLFIYFFFLPFSTTAAPVGRVDTPHSFSPNSHVSLFNRFAVKFHFPALRPSAT